MINGMPPSDFHRFYLRDVDTVVELRWRPPSPRSKAGFLRRLAALLTGPDRSSSPWHAVDHRAFDKAVDSLATHPDGAFRVFTRLGYEVTLLPAEMGQAA
jgi:hypothetical protein